MFEDLVDRLLLLVERLQLLLGGGQLLVGGFEIFPGGLQLFVAGLDLLARLLEFALINRLIIVFRWSFRRKPDSTGFLDAGSNPA
jgi:hypothetical protein